MLASSLNNQNPSSSVSDSQKLDSSDKATSKDIRSEKREKVSAANINTPEKLNENENFRRQSDIPNSSQPQSRENIRNLNLNNLPLKSDIRNSSAPKNEEPNMKVMSSLPPNKSATNSITANRNYLRNNTFDKKRFEVEEPEYNPSMVRRNTRNDSCLNLKEKVELSNLENSAFNVETQHSVKDPQPLKMVLPESTNQETQLPQQSELPEKPSCQIANTDKQAFKTEEAPYIKNNPLTKKYCLVLDLDETLIHYKVDPKNPDEGEMLVRPYMFDCLTNLSKHYELILWTAGTEDVSTFLKLYIVWNGPG